MTTKDEEKAARLAAALRENLRRRKGRERAIDARPPLEDVPSGTAATEPVVGGITR